MDKAELERALADTIAKYGEWVFDIPLPHGLWTRPDEKYPHTRLKRVAQIIHDTAPKPLAQCRILDLGCLDGLYSLELALHGAQVLGIDVREANYQRAVFVKRAYGLVNLEFVKDDVRNVTTARYGAFDIVLCSGILYHLPAPDVFEFLQVLHDMARSQVVIDTHIALDASDCFTHDGCAYHGRFYAEHDASDAPEVIEGRNLSSADANPSFIFSRPSLINFLAKVGFSSVYECFIPAHLNYGKPGLEHKNRCTFLAMKGHPCRVHTSPLAETLQESWPEGSLRY
jgi:SAM-dependent methyltransferase